VAQLGLGLAALGRPEYLTIGHAAAVDGRFDPAALERHCHAVLDAAWDGGVRHVDAARSYGYAERFVIGSKWGYAYVAGFQRGAEVHEVKEHSTARLAEQWPETVHELGGPPDHYLVHSVTPDSPALRDAELLDRLRSLSDEGVRVGISTSGPQQADVVRAALDLDVFSSVQSTWNVLEPSVGPALAEAHAEGWFVVVKEGMANGRLVVEDGTLGSAADAAGTGRDALALAIALAQPWVDVVLSGAASVPQLSQNLQALTVDERIVAGLQQQLAGAAERPQDYWSTRSGLAWT
jgi:aryl-alcohol dehydrogenase-like predicted oxidoreductase